MFIATILLLPFFKIGEQNTILWGSICQLSKMVLFCMQNVKQNKKIFHVPYKLFTRICQSLYLYICPIHFGSSGYLSIALKLILSNSLEWATPQEGESPVKITTLPHPKKWGFFVKVFFNQHISTDVQCTGARCYQDRDSRHLLSGSRRTDKSFGGHVQCWHSLARCQVEPAVRIRVKNGDPPAPWGWKNVGE